MRISLRYKVILSILFLSAASCSSKQYEPSEGSAKAGNAEAVQELLQQQKQAKTIVKKDPILRKSEKYFVIQAKLSTKVYKLKKRKWVGEADNGLLKRTPWVPKQKSIRSKVDSLINKENFARKKIFAIHKAGERMDKFQYKVFIKTYFEQQRAANTKGAPYYLSGQWIR